jgi:hypothetical protein
MSYVRSLIVASILATVAWFVFPVINNNQLDAQLVLAVAVFISVIVGSLLAGSSTTRSAKSGTKNKGVKTIFVGNLAFKVRRDELSKLFSEYGQVNSVRIMTDRETRRPRGFGFIEMGANDAKSAIKALNGIEFMGRDLKVNEANERKAG